MQCAVIPIQNEETSLGRVLETVLTLPIELVIPVINGSRDRSREILRDYEGDPRVVPLEYDTPLGLDVPRAAGTARAKSAGASTLLFVDGDMGGDIGQALTDLLAAIHRDGLDLALTNCYPGAAAPSSTQAKVLYEIRCLLNRALGFGPQMGGASPCHGPHAMSRVSLERIPLEALTVPPVALVKAVQAGLKVGVGACIPHLLLGSSNRGDDHVNKLVETIIGDHLEAFSILAGQKERSRTIQGRTFDGYNSQRRRDLLPT